MLVRVGVVAGLFGVSTSTIRRWEREQLLPSAYRTKGGHRRFNLNDVWTVLEEDGIKEQLEDRPELKRPQAFIYGRVSGSKQQQDLKTQINHLKEYVEGQGWECLRIYKDIGSGLNDGRKGLLQLVKDLFLCRPELLVSTYPDRLARFGVRLLQVWCEVLGVRLVFTQQKDTEQPFENQLTSDVIALVTSFAGKVHRRRRGKLKQRKDVKSD